MRFSVLLPTRNGGDFLENCILSILEQDHSDFELVISDNANTDSTKEIIQRFSHDSRLKCVFQGEVISVSENWTAALHASNGDYVLMMGDDDYLLPGALKKLDHILKRHLDPECLLFNGYSFVSPKAISENLESYWSEQHYSYGADFLGEMQLQTPQRLSIVNDMFRFRQRIPLNMQTTVFARRAIRNECADVFRAPFPDHYLLNALLISAEKWIFSPERLVVVGVSPKSFGHYFYSQSATAGLSYLGINTHFPGALPGSELLNGMYSWLLDLKKHYPNQLHNTKIDQAGYVRRQVYSWIMQFRFGGISTKEIFLRSRLLTISDWFGLVSTVFDRESWVRVFRLLKSLKKSQAESLWHGLRPLAEVTTIREFAFWLTQKNDTYES